MKSQSSQAIVHACVLAAGSSTRFGVTKLVQHLRGKPLIQHALLAAQHTCKGLVTVVVGHDEYAVAAASAGLSDHIVVNGDHQLGIGSSIAAGIFACRDGADAILVLLADQPLVTAAHLQDLIDAWSGADTEIVATSFDGIVSPPILFPGASFDALSELSGDVGAKTLLSDSAFNVRHVDFPPARLDVDTPLELQDLDQD